MNIPMDKIISTPDRDQGNIDSLANSIQQLGLLQPIILRSNPDGTYNVIDGRRRFAALQKLGVTELLDRHITFQNSGSADVMAHVANVERKSLTPAEEVRQLAKLSESHTVEQLAALFGRTQGWIARRLKISSLIPEWLAVLDDPELAPLWPLDKLALIARQSRQVQDELKYMLSKKPYLSGYPVKFIAEKIAHYNRLISAAMFDTSACRKCKDNSASSELLFDDTDAAATCLNRACWIRKSLEAVKAAIKKEGLIPLEGSGGCYGAEDRKYADKIHAKERWHFSSIRDPKKNEKPNAIYVCGDEIGRRVVAIEHKTAASAASSASAAPKEKKPLSVKEMEDALSRKREKKALQLLLTYIINDDSPERWAARVPDGVRLADMLLVIKLFGYKGKYSGDYACHVAPDDIKAGFMDDIREDVYYQAYHSVRHLLEIETRQTLNDMSQIARAGIAKLMRIESAASECRSRAELEIPEPKSLTEARRQEKEAKKK